MFPANELVRTARKKLGISQLELSHLSDVSLATIQNLESGRANPSLKTLTSILSQLGIELGFADAPADWEALVDHGLPLSKQSSATQPPTAGGLLHHLRLAARDIDRGLATDDAERKRESLEALLLALATSFPSSYRKWFARSRLFERFTPNCPNGRVIKLKRIAEARLAEYL